MPKINNAAVGSKPKKKADDPLRYIVRNQVRRLVKSHGYCVGKDLIEALSSRIQQIVETGMLRAEANGRKTVRASDI